MCFITYIMAINKKVIVSDFTKVQAHTLTQCQKFTTVRSFIA